ncbi:conserved hypothetical protein [Deferribacter desulfuricans SSM1]|uniref:Methyl-accepting transducer domain-containing protein n=1 Tax=Deferribacter desulfuricans (strain DSM 14783 / JCM 11476 / NBRC 101012 / SSM1) TaxID=639282 RepID=D3PDK0_DEFDS|nr:hypothetical protein [Deferribacter desulfuricans]BAI80673.1 conserved hypothetical protein [Deferribacter desulfuricans SSM1]
MDFQAIKNNLDILFQEIIEIITDLINLDQVHFQRVIDTDNFINSKINTFLSDTVSMIENIKSTFNKKISDINIDQLKSDIEHATSTFISITDDLEILSYNTICKTYSLGEKGATIAYLSKEIKKHSDKAKSLLNEISNNFNNIYKNFRETIQKLRIKNNFEHINKSTLDNSSSIGFSASISKLVEYSQFHDIYIQQIAKIEEALNSIKDEDNQDKSYLGKKFKLLKEILGILENIKNDLENILDEISNEIKLYVYNINTDIQNVISKTSISESIFKEIEKEGAYISNIIDEIYENIISIQNTLTITENNIFELKKFSKSFNVLIVISAIEVARIGETSLNSLIDSMNKTYNKLQELIQKLTDTINLWQILINDLNGIITESKEKYNSFKGINFGEKFDSLVNNNNELTNSVNNIKNLLTNKDYYELISNFKSKIIENIENMINIVKEEFDNMDKTLPESIKQSQEFIDAYNNTELTIIKADDEDLSSVEFF